MNVVDAINPIQPQNLQDFGSETTSFIDTMQVLRKSYMSTCGAKLASFLKPKLVHHFNYFFWLKTSIN